MIRTNIHSFVFALLILCSCNNSSTLDIKGTYTAASAEGEFSIAKDVMEVSPLSADSKDLFSITINSTYQRKLGPDSLGPVTKAEPLRLQGRYDAKNHALYVEEWQRSLAVDLSKGTIDNQGTIYTRVSSK